MNQTNNNKKVFVPGNFNVLHAGHIRLFKYARDFGNFLIVGLYADESPESSALVTQAMRSEALLATTLVDDVVIIRKSVADTLREIKPQVVVKGAEHRNKENVESLVLKEWGGDLKFFTSDFQFSISDLLKTTSTLQKSLEQVSLESFRTRRDICKDRLIQSVKDFSKIRVCVVGDVIVDTYINCSVLGMSSEAPEIVFSEIDSTSFVGGAGIVAKHCASLGAETHFFSSIGGDVQGEFAASDLKSSGIHLGVIIDKTSATTHKRRYRHQGGSLFRLSAIHRPSFSDELERKLISEICSVVENSDLLIISDFNYGVLSPLVIQSIVQTARNFGVVVVGDNQTSSQLGSLVSYKCLDLITPTEREARGHLRNGSDGLAVIAKAITKELNARYTILKLGIDGFIVHSRDTDELDDLPALNSSPLDVSGAGDSLLVLTALGLTSGLSIWESSYLGALAASIQVSRIGNVPIEIHEILDRIESC